ncbi:TetR/AcrR family transcriptional regulator [Fulvivirgaceae bacterium BMA12]|uniref:TetR/AcrR family transcriptional regulator n=1 Tax=Agaribacillus aureus TaxID=3051825 RepID=A0ABT8L5N1_9BACT|nr:TetR/AcrR family transcriptional regulator [Fulvivirgaceae bacterium BMA12]
MSKGIDTREKIISKSAELFNVLGYHGCSLSDIMKATNLKKGGIYNHFKNKDEIALEAFDYSFKRIQREFRKRLDLDKTPTEKLNSIIEVYAQLASVPGMEGGCPIFNTAVDASNSHPLLKQKANDAINSLKKYIDIKIKEGIASGEFRENADQTDIASLIIMTLEGALIMSRVYDHCSIDVAVKSLKDYLKDRIYKN